MKKLILMGAMIVLAAAGSVQAQKEIKPIGPPIPFDQTISIEDDANGSFLVFSTGTGKYQYTRCSDGFTMSGAGVVKVSGCSIFLEDLQADHRVVASINECDQQAKALVEKFAPVSISPNTTVAFTTFDVQPFKATLIDQNMSNNLLDCAPKK